MLTITNIKTEFRQYGEDFDVDKHNKIGSKSFFNRGIAHIFHISKGFNLPLRQLQGTN